MSVAQHYINETRLMQQVTLDQAWDFFQVVKVEEVKQIGSITLHICNAGTKKHRVGSLT